MSTDGFIFSQDGKTLLKCEFSKLGTVISVPSGVTKIGNGVFAEAPVTKVILPDSVTEIGQNLFSSCETLEDVKLPSNLASLKPFTFAGCSSLRKITMPDSVTSLPEGLFWGCMSLEEIPFRHEMETLETDVCRDCESISSVQIPPTVKTIKSGAFAGCTKLNTIVFPAGLERIEDRSLAGLRSLQYMRFAGDCNNFFVDENCGALYQLTENGAVLIKCPVNIESIYLVENTCDVHVDAFECCTSLAEVYASENAPEVLINKLMELVPAIDINSYSEEASEEEQFAEKIEGLGENLDDVKVDENEFSPIGNFTQDDSYDQDAEISINQSELESILNQNKVSAEPEESEQPPKELSEDEKIQEILNSQCCRNDSLDDGFRPVSIEELEKLMNGPVVDPMEQLKANSIDFSDNENKENSEEIPEIKIDVTIDHSQDEKSEDDKFGEEFIQSILNEQCCRNDSLDDGFRPVTTEELEYLMKDASVQEEIVSEEAKETKTKKKRASKKSKKIETTSTDITENSSASEDLSQEKPKTKRTSRKKKSADNTNDSTLENSENKPKRKRAARKSKKADTVEIPTVEHIIESVPETEPVITVSEEPRFIRAMQNLASHQMVVEDSNNEMENVYGDLKELLVIADGVAPSTNDFSSHLVKFSKAVAKKYGFTKIYFFEDLPLDNPEFIYGLESFGNFRNVLYACNKPDAENISAEQKELINATGISLPENSKIHSVKEKLGDTELQYPVKILVQDNYIEGLLYCAERIREIKGIK